MPWAHPLLQLAATLLAGYVMALGLRRARALHWGRRIAFDWKGHVFWGRIVLATWLLGFAGGLAFTRFVWASSLVTGAHWRLALAMTPLLVFGFATGQWLARRKARRRVLPLLHGINNAVLLGLALCQIVTGWAVLRNFVLE